MGMSNKGLGLLCLGIMGVCSAGSMAAGYIKNEADKKNMEENITEEMTKKMISNANSPTTIKEV